MTNVRNMSMRPIADWLGITASATCAIHCLLLPTLLVTGAVLPTSFLGDESFHKAMVWIVVPAAVLAFGIGCRQHKDRGVLILGFVGLSGIVLSAFVLHDVIGEVGERIGTLISAAILVAAHYRNLKLCRKADCSHEPA